MTGAERSDELVVDYGATHSGSTGYNVLAIPVAAGALVRWGVDLPMAVGALAMSAPTIIAAANAQLLRRLKLREDAPAAIPSAVGNAAAHPA